jgi:hypothetical protein
MAACSGLASGSQSLLSCGFLDESNSLRLAGLRLANGFFVLRDSAKLNILNEVFMLVNNNY